jgi:hypothetical protein
MSGQEEQSNINHVEDQGESQLEIESATAAPAIAPVEDNNGRDELSAIQNLMMASVGRDILDHMYYYGIPLRQIPMSDVMGQDDAASILNRSLYDRNPVKKVISDEARLQLTETKFTASMVAQMNINDACGIWQDDFEEGEPITILPCNHAFKQPAIMKWLEEEKAECPVCRKPLHSKEVNERQSLMFQRGGQAVYDRVDDQHNMDDMNHANDRDRRNHDELEQESDNYRNVVQVNNIASRLAHGVAGYVGQNHSQRSVSMPVNQLLQSLRIMSSSIRRSHEPVRASIPSMGGAAAPPSNYEPRGDVRAVPVPAPPVHAAHPDNVNNYNIINNYYHNNNDDIINNNINIINIINDDFISNQEQNDIEEAIRRSLEN